MCTQLKKYNFHGNIISNNKFHGIVYPHHWISEIFVSEVTVGLCVNRSHASALFASLISPASFQRTLGMIIVDSLKRETKTRSEVGTCVAHHLLLLLLFFPLFISLLLSVPIPFRMMGLLARSKGQNIPRNCWMSTVVKFKWAHSIGENLVGHRKFGRGLAAVNTNTTCGNCEWIHFFQRQRETNKKQ